MFEWFKSKPKEEYKVPTLDELRFGTLSYKPKEDITSYEVAQLLPLFITMYHFNRREYIERNNLMRHFEEKKDASKSK